MWDGFPVNPGHALLIPYRHVSSWFDATSREKAELIEAIDVAHAVAGGASFNIGINVGEIAGQTIPHLHVHLIPRVEGDVLDPTGGVRWVVPARANYRKAPTRTLLTPGESGLLANIRELLWDRRFDRIDIAVSFVMLSGLELLGDDLRFALQRGALVRILTTDYLDITDGRALLRLLDMAEENSDHLSIRVFHDDATSFHTKGFAFWSSNSNASAAIVGSSNLSRSGLVAGIEWNLLTGDVREVRSEFETLWADMRSSPLSREWLREYRHRPPKTNEMLQFIEVRDAPRSFEPHAVQQEALSALSNARAEKFGAGLVVMATGLGKTVLAAFDSRTARRVLFIAHREEILTQSRDTFRCVQPQADLGLYFGREKTPGADVVFASIQTLALHLDAFRPDEFDYIVVDEFHHAAARSYRKVLQHFTPEFLLGLTATPDRMDGADLLSLCGDNLVYRCDLVQGIRRELLCPFTYYGVRDVVDFTPIPWRSGRFDPEELTRAVETLERADQALAEWNDKAKGCRTLAFCVSVSHADFMARHFRAANLRVAAVHSGPTSDPRRESIERLSRGELDVIFSVDVFNEGLDVPAVDCVLMLRPTESPIIFLQQLGRGLRRSSNPEKVLTVIDFIGNHRSFLLKPRTLLSLGAREAAPGPRLVLEAMQSGEFQLPPGCRVRYDLGLVDMFRELLRLGAQDQLALWCRELADETGFRPTAVQAFRAGYLLPNKADHGWFDLLQSERLLDADEAAVLESSGAFLRALQREPITKSYKLITLRALLHEDALLTGMPVSDIARVARALSAQDPRLIRDLTNQEFPDPLAANERAWTEYWRRWPVAAWIGELRGQPGKWFRLKGDRFEPLFTVQPEHGETFKALVAELVDYRLARYLVGKEPLEAGVARCKVSHSGGNPIIRRPPGRDGSLMPLGDDIPFTADGERYFGDFVKIALNVARRPGQPGNALHALLRGWFGPGAGHAGTDHHVIFENVDGEWVLRRADVHTLAAAAGRSILPVYTDYAVACGAFGAPAPRASAKHREIGIAADPNHTFVLVARGDSMSGGNDPIRHGDPLLLEWVRDARLDELVDSVVLVERQGSPVLKRLAKASVGFELRSDKTGDPPIAAGTQDRVLARLVKRLSQAEVNPLARHLHEQFKREDIPPLFAEVFNPGNWNSGHVSLADRTLLLVTLDKGGMSAGGEYEDRLEQPDLLAWSSQASTTSESKKGRELIGALDEGRDIHIWLRAHKREAFTYAGLGVLLPGFTGNAPIRMHWRLLTPLPDPEFRRLAGAR